MQKLHNFAGTFPKKRLALYQFFFFFLNYYIIFSFFGRITATNCVFQTEKDLLISFLRIIIILVGRNHVSMES